MADRRDQPTDKYGIPKQTHPTAATGAPGSTGAFVTSDPLGAPGTTGADFTSADPTIIPGGFSPIYDNDTEVYATTDDVTGGGQQQQLQRPTGGEEMKEEENKVREHDDERGAQYSVQREIKNLGQETNIPHVDSPHRPRELHTSGGGGYGLDQEEEKTSQPKPDLLEMKTQRRHDSSQGTVPTAQAHGTGEVYGHHQNPTPTDFSTASCPRESGKMEYESFPAVTTSAPGSFKTSDPLGVPGTTGAGVTATGPTTIPGVGAAAGGVDYDPVVGGRTNISRQQQFHHQQQQPQQQFYHPTAAGAAGYNIGQGGGRGENPNQSLNRENKTKQGAHADPNVGQGAARIQVVHSDPGAGVVYGRETITTTANLPPAGGGHMSGQAAGAGNNQAPPEQWERLEKKGMPERAKEIKDRLLPGGGGGGGSH